MQLKPCPFCGEVEDVVVRDRMKHGAPISIVGKRFWRVECLPCDCRTGDHFDDDAEMYGFSGKDMAIMAWNRRDG